MGEKRRRLQGALERLAEPGKPLGTGEWNQQVDDLVVELKKTVFGLEPRLIAHALLRLYAKNAFDGIKIGPAPAAYLAEETVLMEMFAITFGEEEEDRNIAN